jgi:hypothetical protein
LVDQKREHFISIKDRVWRRLQGWKEKLLSQVGREILIKAVIQAIPTYAMTCFKFPGGLCAELSSMAMHYWWGQRGEERKIRWLRKQHLSHSKKDGGIGFRNLQLFNIALLACQGWRLLQHPNSLVFRILKAKYFPTQSFLEASVRGHASYLWRSICEAKESLKLGLRWRVGNGAHIKIWKDAWVLTNSNAMVLSPVHVLDEDAMVEQLIDPIRMCWKEGLID